ncbi:hypothetical protein [Emticicia sp. W12TSBA100-4]
MKTNHNVEPDFAVINKPLPEADRKKLSEIIAKAKKNNPKKLLATC